MNWLREIEQAMTIEELMGVVNDFILQQPDEHWSWIPKSSRPKLIASESELHHWHHQVTLDLLTGKSPNIRMQDLAVFFLRASAHAHQLALKQELRGGSNQRDFFGY